MTTDVVPADPAVGRALSTVGDTTEALRRLGEWVTAAKQATQLVAPLVDTPFVPENYRPKIDPRATDEEKAEARGVAVATATAAVLQGLTLGLDPLVSLQQIYLVHGRPGLYAKMMVALVQSHGHEVWTEDSTAVRAVVAGRRRGTSHIERVTVTMDQAKRAGWTDNKTYAKTPEDMLWARAASRVCDRIASDVLKGIPAVETIADETAIPAVAGTRIITPRAVAAQPETRAVESAEDWDVRLAPPASKSEPLDERQWRDINEALRLQGVVGPGQKAARLARLTELVGHEVTRGGDLTHAEGERVLAALRPVEPATRAITGPAVLSVEAIDTGGTSLDDDLLDDGDQWPPTAAPPQSEEVDLS